MNNARLPFRNFRVDVRLALASAVAFALVGRMAGPTQRDVLADDGRGVHRLDPFGETLVPVPVDELRVGYIYNHFSDRLQRRVWSFYQGDGRFWFGLGEGTRQPARRLDIPVPEPSAENAADLPGMAQEYVKQQGDIYIRLRDDNRWEFAGRAGVPSIYNLETGRRWEKHADVYMPVSHGGGYHWTVKSGKYVPNLGARGVVRRSHAPVLR
jgi:hypothetical protein